MKKSLFLMLLFILTANVNSQSCEECFFDSNILLSIEEENVLATSALSAQAYFWEVCDGNSEITGSNTNQSVHVNFNGTSTLKLVRFEDGVCSVSCIELNEGNCSDSCCAPLFDVSFICRPNGNGGGAIWFEDPLNCNVDWGSIRSMDISVNGAYFTRYPYYGQNNATLVGPFTNGNWVMPLASRGCPRQISITITFHFNNGCESESRTIKHIVENFDYVNKSDGISIYPNPANNVIHIDGLNNEDQIVIYNTNGKLEMIKSNLLGEIDITQLSKGIYFYNILKNDVVIKKGQFVKE